MTTRRRRALGAGVLVVAVVVALSGCDLDAEGAPTATTPPETATVAPATTPTETTPTPSAPVPSASPTTAVDVPGPSPAPPGLTPTAVTLTLWGYDPATQAAFVGGYAAVVEEGGTCTLVLRNGSTEVAVSAPAAADATTTSCGTLSVPHTQLSSGTWSAELRYASPVSAGSASPVKIEVP